MKSFDLKLTDLIVTSSLLDLASWVSRSASMRFHTMQHVQFGGLSLPLPLLQCVPVSANFTPLVGSHGLDLYPSSLLCSSSCKAHFLLSNTITVLMIHPLALA